MVVVVVVALLGAERLGDQRLGLLDQIPGLVAELLVLGQVAVAQGLRRPGRRGRRPR